jgi:hypothetical protein
VIGNWGNNYWDWYDYANGDMNQRAAFPLRSIMNFEHYERIWNAKIKSWFADIANVVGGPWVELNGMLLDHGIDRPDLATRHHDPAFMAGLQTARDASIFYQAEVLDFESLPDFIQNGNGVVRGGDSTAWNNNFSAQQRQIGLGVQLLMSDRLFAFVNDGD